jgi:hypothetical protein
LYTWIGKIGFNGLVPSRYMDPIPFIIGIWHRFPNLGCSGDGSSVTYQDASSLGTCGPLGASYHALMELTGNETNMEDRGQISHLCLPITVACASPGLSSHQLHRGTGGCVEHLRARYLTMRSMSPLRSGYFHSPRRAHRSRRPT